MKRSQFVSSSRRKSRKAHFTAPSHERRKLMSSSLSKELRNKYGIRSLPIRRDDEVVVMRGTHRGKDSFKVIGVRRLKFSVQLQGVSTEKANGTTVPISFHPSNMDKDRKRTIERKSTVRFATMDKGKIQEEDVQVQ